MTVTFVSLAYKVPGMTIDFATFQENNKINFLKTRHAYNPNRTWGLILVDVTPFNLFQNFIPAPKLSESATECGIEIFFSNSSSE